MKRYAQPKEAENSGVHGKLNTWTEDSRTADGNAWDTKARCHHLMEEPLQRRIAILSPFPKGVRIIRLRSHARWDGLTQLPVEPLLATTVADTRVW